MFQRGYSCLQGRRTAALQDDAESSVGTMRTCRRASNAARSCAKRNTIVRTDDCHKERIAARQHIEVERCFIRDFDGGSIVETALRLLKEQPWESPLHILDSALAGYEGDDLEFEFDYDELQLPHPFAELVRRAFAPDLDITELLLTTVDIEPRDPHLRSRIELARDAWQRAIGRFADRYRIWSPLLDSEMELHLDRVNGRSRQHS